MTMSMINPANYVPTRVVVERLKVTRRTLVNWRRAGKIGYVKTPGGQYRWDLNEYLSQAQPRREEN